MSGSAGLSTSPPASPKNAIKAARKTASLWRDTQRQISELTLKIAATNDAVPRFAEESRIADQKLGQRIDEVDQRLGERIDKFVSAISDMLHARAVGTQ